MCGHRICCPKCCGRPVLIPDSVAVTIADHSLIGCDSAKSPRSRYLTHDSYTVGRNF